MEKAELNKLILMVVIFFICCIQKVTGVSETYLTYSTKCAFSVANIDFNISLDAADSIVGKRTWLLRGSKIAESNGTTLTPVTSYSSRLTAFGTYGISLSNVDVADTGTYTYVVILSPSGNPITATATLSVQAPPNAGCSVDASQSGKIVTCSVSGSCGTPVLEPDWENETGISNIFQCDEEKTYRCCATSDALKNCYIGSPDNFCKVYSCTPSNSNSTTNSSSGKKKCELELGCGIGLGLGIPCVIICIVVVIFICKGDTYAYELGLLLGLGLGITFQVAWIIIVSLISTGNQCTLELGLGLGLSSGMPCVSACIVVVIFMFIEFKGIPSRVNIGRGILKGLLIASVLGIIVVYFLSDKLKPKPTGKKPDEKQQEPTGEKPEETPLEPTDKKNKTKHTGPPAIHIRTQNRVESEHTSKKTSDRPQPLPPVGVVTEDTSKHRPQPPPPENSDVKDQNKRGISANFDDKQGLPTEPPRSSRLPPLTPKQPTVEEEEPKKKRKKKKKAGQMNEETQVEEIEELQIKTTEDQFDGD